MLPYKPNLLWDSEISADFVQGPPGSRRERVNFTNYIFRLSTRTMSNHKNCLVINIKYVIPVVSSLGFEGFGRWQSNSQSWYFYPACEALQIMREEGWAWSRTSIILQQFKHGCHVDRLVLRWFVSKV